MKKIALKIGFLALVLAPALALAEGPQVSMTGVVDTRDLAAAGRDFLPGTNVVANPDDAAPNLALAAIVTPPPKVEQSSPVVKALGGLAKVFDFSAADPATFQTEILRLMVPTEGVQPFAAVAREDKEVEEGKTGFGAGTRWNIGKRANFGTEVLVFPADRMADMDHLGKFSDVRMLTRFEIRF